MEPQSGRSLDDDQDDRVAGGTSDDSARSAVVDDEPPEAIDRAASGATASSIGHFATEKLHERAAQGVAVDMRIAGHGGPPVGPKRSVLTISGAWPSSTSADATVSTKPVGPQT